MVKLVPKTMSQHTVQYHMTRIIPDESYALFYVILLVVSALIQQF